MIEEQTIITTTLIAIFVALMARQLKISEFRQKWIDGVREDISEFVSRAHEWAELYIDFNCEKDQTIKTELASKLDRIKYDAFHTYWRIELRFKPRDQEASGLLSSLIDLVDPGKFLPGMPYANWRGLADKAVLEARGLLKEEWETTKNPFRVFIKWIFRK